MEIRLKDLTDQQCADVVAHFAERKMTGGVEEIIIHTPKGDDVILTKKKKTGGNFDDNSGACAAACFAAIATTM